ncbi:hypothetical protein OHS33_33250 [Streptomyces sp. NBC_00536]|uniref:hypothetical protein n=1 Tax=Streptomyces sp. NBC_00536 TaxID=2975769 RepID=UPI002E81E8EC|nr:hypothetical protein [Streptomyces sp. NBC_00536]WUC82805.1 hypothetical protein OHS33_33250 [Streptomyces sp. NBC_00536]
MTGNHRTSARPVFYCNVVLLAVGLLLTWVISGSLYDYYVRATPVTVTLGHSCKVPVMGSSGATTCEGARWTVDGRTVTGTLRPHNGEIHGGALFYAGPGTEPLSYSGRARALGDTAYSEPRLSQSVAALTTAALAGVALLGAAASAVLLRRGRRRAAMTGAAPGVVPGAVGEVLGRYAARPDYRSMLLVEGAVVVFGAFLAVAVLLPPGEGLLPGIAGMAAALAVVLAAGRGLLAEVRRGERGAVLIGRRGLAVLTGDTSVFVCPWSEASLLGVPQTAGKAADTAGFTVRADGGARHTFRPSGWTGFAELRRAASEAVFAAAWPRAVRDLADGRSVPFGTFTATPTGLRTPGGEFGWRDVGGLRMESPGRALIKTPARDVVLPLARTPDVEVLLGLLLGRGRRAA